MKRLKYFLLLACLLLLAGCTGCNSTPGRYENKPLENICSGDMILEVMKTDAQIAREIACQCTQAAKQSDQNLCESIVNINNSTVILDRCKNDSDCRDVFARRK